MAIDDPLAATAGQYPDQQKNKAGESCFHHPMAARSFADFKEWAGGQFKHGCGLSGSVEIHCSGTEIGNATITICALLIYVFGTVES
jgi:hypothetical protein